MDATPVLAAANAVALCTKARDDVQPQASVQYPKPSTTKPKDWVKALGHPSMQTIGDIYADSGMDQLSATVAEVLADDAYARPDRHTGFKARSAPGAVLRMRAEGF